MGHLGLQTSNDATRSNCINAEKSSTPWQTMRMHDMASSVPFWPSWIFEWSVPREFHAMCHPTSNSGTFFSVLWSLSSSATLSKMLAFSSWRLPLSQQTASIHRTGLQSCAFPGWRSKDTQEKEQCLMEATGKSEQPHYLLVPFVLAPHSLFIRIGQGKDLPATHWSFCHLF